MTRTTRWLASLTMVLALPLPLLSLPWFSLGYWEKAEPLIFWLHAVSALASVTMAVALWGQGAAMLRRISHPFVLAPLSVGVWTLVAAPFVSSPLSSIVGAPQSGFGGLWFFDLAVLIATAKVLREEPRHWAWIGRLALAVAGIVVALKAWDWISLRRGEGHLLIFVASYYGWLALALPLVVGAELRRWSVPLAAGTAVVSTSITTVGLVLVGGFLSRVPPALISRRRAIACVAVASILPLAALQWKTPLLLKESLRDRHLVHRLIEAALAHDPGAWLFGHGWGETQNAFHTWLNVSGERLWSPVWTFLSSDYFHSHDWALESLYAVGIPGLLLTLAGYLVLPVFVPEERRPLALAFAVALALFHGLWFQLCLSLPFMAMATAALADESAPRRLPPARLVAVALGLLACTQVGISGALLARGLEISRAQEALATTPPRFSLEMADFRGNDLAATYVIRDSVVAFADRVAAGESQGPIAAAIHAELAAIDARVPETRSPLLLTTGLSILAELHVGDKLAFAAEAEQMAMWRRWLERLLDIAPERTDAAISYFTALLAQSRFTEVAEISRSLLAENPEDPVGLYYAGIVEALSPVSEARERGLSMIRRALTNGLERYMPIDPDLKASLEGAG